jgi:hypothetical protein
MQKPNQVALKSNATLKSEQAWLEKMTDELQAKIDELRSRRGSRIKFADAAPPDYRELLRLLVELPASASDCEIGSSVTRALFSYRARLAK